MKRTFWLVLAFVLSLGVSATTPPARASIPVSVQLDLEAGTQAYLRFALFDCAERESSTGEEALWQEETLWKGVITNTKSIHLLGTLDGASQPISTMDFSGDLWVQVFYRLDREDPWVACSDRTRVPRGGTSLDLGRSSIGEIRLFAQDTPSGSGWMPCDGRTLSMDDYPELFDLIGTQYGGDGAGFALPDLRGCAESCDGCYLSYFIRVGDRRSGLSHATNPGRNKGNEGFKRVTRLDNHSGLEFTSGGVDYIGLDLLEHEDGVGTIWRAIPKNHDLESSPVLIRIVLAPDVITPL